MADVLIALGGNVGDVRATFKKAIANICGMTQAALLARSSDYTTPPWGEEHQAPFTNACIEIETSLDPHALLFTLHKIEKKFGRDRAHETRWGPRTLDLDLIAYDDVKLDKPELTLPHPRAFDRRYPAVTGLGLRLGLTQNNRLAWRPPRGNFRPNTRSAAGNDGPDDHHDR